MKRKINARLLLIALLVMAAATGSTTIAYYRMFRERVRNDLKVSAELLKDTHYFDPADTAAADAGAGKIDFSADMEELRITWIGADGTVLYDNDQAAGKLQNHADRPEIRQAFAKGEGESVRRSDTMNKNTFYYALLLDNGTVLRVSAEAESIWSVFLTAAPLIAVLLLFTVALSVALSHMLTVQLIRPIERMAENIGDAALEPPYRELAPFADMIRRQHEDILSAAKARQDFTANVSHELKTPLTAVSGYAELIDSGMADQKQERHFIREIRKNADRLLVLIDDIIRLSELDRSPKEPAFEALDLYDAAAECLEALKVSARKRQVALHFSGGHCIIRGNREMIRELIDNLVQNAIRYNRENGSVWVEAAGGDSPRLIVKDNGIGIPEADCQRVFERFYRVDKSRSKETGGTGLGLAIVKHIVEIHGAKIELKSEEGKGTEVAVFF